MKNPMTDPPSENEQSEISIEMSTDLSDQPVTNSINQSYFQYGIEKKPESQRNITEETSMSD